MGDGPRPSLLPASLLTRSLLPSPRRAAGAGSRCCGPPPAQPAQADPVQTALLEPRGSFTLLCSHPAVPSRLFAAGPEGRCPARSRAPGRAAEASSRPKEEGPRARPFVRGERYLLARELPRAGPPPATGEVRPVVTKPLKDIDREAEGFERAAVAL